MNRSMWRVLAVAAVVVVFALAGSSEAQAQWVQSYYVGPPVYHSFSPPVVAPPPIVTYGAPPVVVHRPPVTVFRPPVTVYRPPVTAFRPPVVPRPHAVHFWHGPIRGPSVFW